MVDGFREMLMADGGTESKKGRRAAANVVVRIKHKSKAKFGHRLPV